MPQKPRSWQLKRLYEFLYHCSNITKNHAWNFTFLDKGLIFFFDKAFNSFERVSQTENTSLSAREFNKTGTTAFVTGIWQD